MIEFSIKSTVSLTVFLALYILLLEKEKIHNFKRFYLLVSVVISIIIPFISFEIVKVVKSVRTTIPNNYQNTTEPLQSAITKQNVDYTSTILWILYGIISLALLFRFGKNIWNLYYKSYKNNTIAFKNAKLVLINDNILPHTFLNLIFVNSNDYNNQSIEAELYSHELVHVNQKHTLDILFIELLKCIFWFNPIYIFYKKTMQLNHEFLADEYIVKTFNNVSYYQELLLQKSYNNQTIYLASNLNYLVTKKRLIMMTKRTNQKFTTLKKIAVVPVIAGLIYLLCIEVVAQVNPSKFKVKPLNIEQTDQDKLRDKYYSGIWVNIIDESEGRNDFTMYEDLKLYDKRKYLYYLPGIIKENKITKALIQKMKTNNMDVWVDGIVVSRNELQKYSVKDFSYYTSSIVNSDAKGKLFPQQYQYSLYTKNYFNNNLKNSHLHFQKDTVKVIFTNYKSNLKKLKSTTTIDSTSNSIRAEKVVIVNMLSNKKESTTILTDTTLIKATELDELPTFDGGNEAFKKYIKDNFKTPQEITDNKLSGRIFVEFIVEKDGKLNNITVIRDLGYDSGKEAKRMLENSPKWIPGKKNGKAVRTKYVVPIVIK